MENSVTEHHPTVTNHLHTKPLFSCFDIRLFYVRITSFTLDTYTPEYLTLTHIPLNPNTILEINNKPATSCRLKRNRLHKNFEEATFVTTDSVRLSGSLKFEVFDAQDLILSGILEMSNDKSKMNDAERWTMRCESMVGPDTRVFKGKYLTGCDSMPPMIEVYVAGSVSGAPVILTKVLQVNFRKKQTRKGALDPIPDGDLSEPRKDVAYGLDFKNEEYRPYKTENGYDYNNSLHWGQNEYMEGEDGALKWFNAGVRVGVGLGLGICLGVGIGVGLLVRTYQSATQNFKRRLL